MITEHGKGSTAIRNHVCSRNGSKYICKESACLGLAGDTTTTSHFLHLELRYERLDEGCKAFYSLWIAFAILVPSIQFLNCVDVSFKVIAMAQFEVDPAVRIADRWENVGAVQQPTCIVGGEAGHVC